MSTVPETTRRRFLQATAVAGSVATLGSGLQLTTLERAEAQPLGQNTKIVKNICHQCPARCGIDVYVTDGRVHAIYGTSDHPISNGKLCPKGYLGAYVLYDPDRFKGPMRRTNPRKGRNEDPQFVPISWEEALDTVAERLNSLRRNGESHRFALLFGRGWGASDAGILGTFGKLYGSPNVGLGHSSMCSDGSKKAKQALDGNNAYNAYDYAHTNYILMFGCGFLEAFRPYNNNMQVWGYIRGEKSPKTRVTAVDVHMNTTLAAADRALLIRPGTDGALALAIAHVILAEGLWERSFVGDFLDGVNRFRPGETVDPSSFAEVWTHGLVEWWNIELKDRTPEWAEPITDIRAEVIRTVAREFGSTRPAMAIQERGAHAHSNGILNAMAIHALNALVGSMFAEGGLMYQLGPSYGPPPANAEDFLDDYARNGPWKEQPRIDLAGHPDGYLLADNMMHLAKGFADDPGDNGVRDFDTWVEKGCWYKKPYPYRQVRGTFYKWDGRGYNIPMTPEEVREKLLKTPTGRFEFRSGWLEQHADWIAEKTGRPRDKLMFPHWEEPKHPGGGDLYLVTPKLALHAEGRGANIPYVIAYMQPVTGGRGVTYCEIHPRTAAERGIADGDEIVISSEVGQIRAYARLFEGVRPDTVVLPMETGHWAHGRWAKGRMSEHSGYVTVNQSDRISGQCNYYTTKVRVQRA